MESKTSQRYFVDNLNSAAAGDTVNLYINSVGGRVKGSAGNLQRPAPLPRHCSGITLTDTPLLRLLSLLWRRTKLSCRAIRHDGTQRRRSAYGTATQLRKAADDLEVINLAAIQSTMNKTGRQSCPPANCRNC